MKLRMTAAMVLLSTAAWATEQVPAAQEKNPDLSGLLTDGKKPCDADKKKAEAEAEAKKNEAALQGILAAEKKPEPAQKSLGAVPAMGNCK